MFSSRTTANTNLETSNWDWAIDPIGLRIALRRVSSRYALPMMITENGPGEFDTRNADDTIHDYLKQTREAPRIEPDDLENFQRGLPDFIGVNYSYTTTFAENPLDGVGLKLINTTGQNGTTPSSGAPGLCRLSASLLQHLAIRFRMKVTLAPRRYSPSSFYINVPIRRFGKNGTGSFLLSIRGSASAPVTL